jgi:hypothetical protein
MTKSYYLELKKSIESQLKHGTLAYVGFSLIVVALSSFGLYSGFFPEELKFATISLIFAVIVISQVLALMRIRKLNKSLNFKCYNCKSQLSAEKIAEVVDNGICPFCGKTAYSV